MTDVLFEYDAVVVHFENDAVYGVLSGLAAQTVLPQRVWVVDNSASIDPARIPSLPYPVELLGPVGNRGYAAAVNAVRGRGTSSALLVLTHEVVLDRSCAEALLHELHSSGTVGAAGPVLRFSSAPDRTFSSGGTLDRWSWPRHVTSSRERSADVEWMDGSVMLLRYAALEEVDWLGEEYFLYFEEIDLALRLQERGWRTVVTPDAVASQEPGGYPPYLALRNRVMLIRTHPQILRVPRPLLLVRLLVEIAWVARRRGPASIPPSLRGLVDGYRRRVGRPGGQ